MVANKLNATVVEPCIRSGALRACGNSPVRLHQIFNVRKLRQYYPRIVSHEEYQAMVAAQDPIVVPMCFQNPTRPSMVKRSCGNFTNMYQRAVIPPLERALRQNDGTTVIHINYYRLGGFRKTTVGGETLVDLGKSGLQVVLDKHFAFTRRHYDIVDNLLQLMGISNTSDFDVIHWRAEKTNIDYDDCASKILQARQAMGNKTTVLMSSINQHADMLWYKPERYNQSDAIRSLDRLLDSGFHKLDQVLEKVRNMIPDKVVLPVWDQIIAQKARRFATCTRGCVQTKDACVACNFGGNFAPTTVSLRSNIGKSSYVCWPT